MINLDDFFRSKSTDDLAELNYQETKECYSFNFVKKLIERFDHHGMHPLSTKVYSDGGSTQNVITSNLFSSASVVSYKDLSTSKVANVKKSLINKIEFSPFPTLKICSGPELAEAGLELDASYQHSLSMRHKNESFDYLSRSIQNKWHSPRNEVPLLNFFLAANALVENEIWSKTAISPLHDFIDVQYKKVKDEPLVKVELTDESIFPTFPTKFITMTLEEYVRFDLEYFDVQSKFEFSDCPLKSKLAFLDRPLYRINGVEPTFENILNYNKLEPELETFIPKELTASTTNLKDYMDHIVIPVEYSVLTNVCAVPYIMLHLCNIVGNAIQLKANLKNACSNKDLNDRDYEVKMRPYSTLTKSSHPERAIIVLVDSASKHRKNICIPFYKKVGDSFEIDQKKISDSNSIDEFDLNLETQNYLRYHVKEDGTCSNMIGKNRIYRLLRKTMFSDSLERCLAISTELCWRIPIPKQIMKKYNGKEIGDQRFDTFNMVFFDKEVKMNEENFQVKDDKYNQINYLQSPEWSSDEKSLKKFEDIITAQHLLTLSPNFFPVYHIETQENEKDVYITSEYKVSRAENLPLLAIYCGIFEDKKVKWPHDLRHVHSIQSKYAVILNASITAGHTKLGLPCSSILVQNPKLKCDEKISRVLSDVSNGSICVELTHYMPKSGNIMNFDELVSFLSTRPKKEGQDNYLDEDHQGDNYYLFHYPMPWWMVKSISKSMGFEISSEKEMKKCLRYCESLKSYIRNICVNSSVELNDSICSVNYLANPSFYWTNAFKFRKATSGPIPISLLQWTSHKVLNQLSSRGCKFSPENFQLTLATLSNSGTDQLLNPYGFDAAAYNCSIHKLHGEHTYDIWVDNLDVAIGKNSIELTFNK